MSEQLTIVFFLWRHPGMTPAAFEDFYNNDHQELVARTVSPPPLLFERNFRVGDPGPTDGIDSFDSFTAATFASSADFESWGAILADPATARALDENEAEFTRPERRMQLFAEPVRSGAHDPVQTPGTEYLLRLGRARPGIDRAEFKIAHEAAIADGGPIEGALRRVRYYPQPDHALSYARDAWTEGLKASPDVIEHLSLQDATAAQAAVERLHAETAGSSSLESERVVHVRQFMRPPTAWRDHSVQREQRAAKP